MKIQDIWELLKATFSEWSEDKASRLAAALAYYTVFSLAPLLIIAIAVAGMVFGQEAARGEIVAQIESVVGQQGAEAIQTMIANAGQSTDGGIIATVIGLATLIFAATGAFAQLQDALNTVWEVSPETGSGVLGMIRTRFLSFTMILGIGFLLLVSLVISAALSAIGGFFGNLLPGYDILWQGVNFLISFGVTTLLFAMIFKVLPDVDIAWSDVWVGALVTALLFTLGKFLIGLYLGRSSVSSTYGAAGSFVVVLLWVYYSAQILLLGAEFTQVYANRYGSRIRFSEGAAPLSPEERTEQGLEPADKTPSTAQRKDTPKTRQVYHPGRAYIQPVRQTGSSGYSRVILLSLIVIGVVATAAGSFMKSGNRSRESIG